MPPPRDIAWKFVIEQEGEKKNQKKWRCPYCEKVYFGQVTRVRNHLLKISDKGIAPCQKVPEHISTLMGWLQNQVRNKDDIAWKFVHRLEDKKWRCYHCSEEFFGDLTRVKGHLLRVPNDGISVCTEVADHVRKLMWSLLDGVAEEESREANSQSSKEPQSCDLLTQAEVAEGESREANRQLSTMPSLVRNSHGSNILEQPASVSPQHQSVPHQSTYHGNVQPDPTMLLGNPDTTRQPDPLNHRLDAREPPALLDQPTHLETGSEQQNPRRLSSFPNDQFPGNSMSYWPLELKGGDVLPNPLLSNITKTSIPQYSNEQFPSSDEQFADRITSDSPIFSPDLLYLHRPQSQTLMDIDPPTASQHTSDSHNFEATSTDSEVPGAAMDTIGPSSSQDIQRGFSNHVRPDRHAKFCTLAQERIPENVGAFPISTSHPPNVEGATHLKTGSEQENSSGLSSLSSLPNEQYPSPAVQFADGIPSDLPATPGCSNFHSLLESRDANVNTSEEIQMNELHAPTMRSSLQNDSSVDVDGTNRLPDCSQAGVVEVVHTTDSHSITAEVAEEESREAEERREANRQFATETPSPLLSPGLLGVRERLGFNQQDVIGLNSDQQSEAERRFHQSSTMPSSVRNSHVQPALVPLQHQSVPHQSVNHCTRNVQQNPTMHLDNLDTTQQPDLLNHRLDAAHGNEIASSPQQLLMDSTNTTGPSSSQEMNRVSPIMNEMIRNLKRKVEELNYKEAVTKEQMEIESCPSSVRKKPRIVVQKWLNETERARARARNNFQMIGQANAEILPPTEQVETLMREVEELIEQTLPHPLLIEARDAKGNAFLERKLIGEKIHTDIELIWNCLKENNGCKLGIYGMGGVGKTTIMHHVHNRLLKDATFDGVLFITVSQDFSIYKLQSDVWKALKSGVMEDEHEKKRAVTLWEHLERKRNFVLILDDVWQHFKLQDVGIPDRDGLKVVLTTRSSKVCSQMDCEEIKIQPLGEEEAWKLFEQELGPKLLTNKQVEKVARKIANRCAGLPLAINTMASSMRGENNIFVWQDTLNELERSHTKHTEMGDKVLPVLKLSYERLPGSQVKQCFVFCALFPEDASIKKKELIEYFIDEGFLDELDTREEQYCRGLAIVDKLRNACLLELDDDCYVRMHDLMRDMALHIMNTTCMVKAGQGLRTIPNGERWTEDLEKVSLMWSRIEDIPPDMSPNCPKLSTLLLNGSLRLKNLQVQDSFFVNLRGLKVLNLSECAITKLPDSLSELANLRALLLRYCRSLIRIPCLGKLKYLRKLDAVGCESLLAVEGLEELSNLRYLDLSETGIERSWEGTFSRMVNLQYLKIAGRVKAEEVIRLKALKRLECNFGNVDDFNEYVRFMERRVEHHDYGLAVDQEKSLWSISESVYSDREILPKNEMEYEWDEGYDYYERFMKIRSCNYAMARVGEERNKDCILIPGDVELFKGENCCDVTNLFWMSRLRDLKVLKIEEWDNLVELFGGAGVDAEEIDNTQDSPAPLFPSLKKLIISRCSKLKYLFGHESRFSLSLLCEGIEGMNSSVASLPQPEESGNMKRVVGSEWLPRFPSLKRIRVKDCNNIRELFPHQCLLHLPNLEEMTISCCEKLEKIIGGGPVPIGATCGRLRRLSVNGCNNMKGVLLTQDMLLHLPSLQEISVQDCEGIEEIIGGGPVSIGATCGLTRLVVKGCNNMKGVLLTQDMLLHLPSLEWLSVGDCEGIDEIIGGGPVPIGATCGRLSYLSVNGCNSMKRVLKTQDMLLHLPFLERISVQNCKGIEVIMGVVANTTRASFPKLTDLTLWNLSELKSICDGDGTVSYDSLQDLYILKCPKLKTIPVQLPLLGLLPYPPPLFNIL